MTALYTMPFFASHPSQLLSVPQRGYWSVAPLRSVGVLPAQGVTAALLAGALPLGDSLADYDAFH